MALVQVGLCMALMAAEGAGSAEIELRSLVIEAVREGAEPAVYVELFGRRLRGTVNSAEENGLTARVLGQEVRLAWTELKPRELLKLARRCASMDDGDQVFLLARFAVEKKLRRADDLVDRLRELDPGVAEKLAPRARAGREPESGRGPEEPAPRRTVPSVWEPVGLSGGGGMFTPAVSPHDPNLIMVNCDMGGAYVSRDGGDSWRMVHWAELSSSTRCRPVFHPTDPRVIYAVSDRYYRSTLKVSRDRGLSWAPLAAEQPWGKNVQIRELAVDAGDGGLLLVGLSEGAFASGDGGRSWWRCEGLDGAVTGFHVDQTSPKGRRTCFAGTSRGVFRSDDGGRTWMPKDSGLPLDYLRRGEETGIPALGSSRAGWRFMSFAGGSNAKSGIVVLYVTLPGRLVGGKLVGGVYRSSDRAETWERAMGPGINLDTKAADPWGTGSTAQYSFVLTTNARPRTVYVANTSTGHNPPHHTSVYRSDDAGRNWRSVFFSDPRFKEFNVGHDYRTANEGWNDQDPARFLSISPADPGVLVYTNDMRCYVTTDGGRFWKAAHTKRAPGQGELEKGQRWLCNGLVVTTTWHYYFDPFDSQRRYIAYTDIGFARSADGGRSWCQGAAGVPWCGETGGGGNCYELALDPEVPGRMWGAFGRRNDFCYRRHHLQAGRDHGGGGVAVTADYGDSWKPSSRGLPEGPVTSLVLDSKSPRDARVLYAASFGRGVYKSTDGGGTWTKKSAGLGPGKCYRVRLHPDGTLFASSCGLIRGGKFVSGAAAVFRSTDGAESWQCVSSPLKLHWIMDFSLDPRDGRVIYLGARDNPGGGEEGGLYRTSDGGATWTRVARKGPEHFGATVHPGKRGWVYMTLSEDNPAEGLWLSRDGGATWAPFGRFPFQKAHRVSFNPGEPGVIYVTTFGGSVWRGPAAPASPEQGRPGARRVVP